MHRRPVPLGLVVYLIIGVVVASGHHYLDHLNTLGTILSAVLAVVLWPLVLFGVKIAITT